MYPDYLIHYGVKGMKWGVRKTSFVSPNQKKSIYFDDQRIYKVLVGKKGNKRVNKRIEKYKSKGMSTEAAKNKVATQEALKLFGLTSVATATYFLHQYPDKAKNAMQKIATALYNARGIYADDAGAYYDSQKDVIGKIRKIFKQSGGSNRIKDKSRLLKG